MLGRINATRAILPTPEEFHLDLAGLRLEHCREVDRDIAEGVFQHGPGTTVQVLAVKLSESGA
ncbi:hypothetical protein [Nocardia grenadensis]|uniref:hypothetical protein n=1 Tax=Nocardia grenadensis TaxID=931537 RepID=UPI003D74AE8C